jgi:hypothetical protein
MKFLFLSLVAFAMSSVASFAQQITVQVSENGSPVAYHNITVSQGSYEVGTGQTDASGFADISGNGLQGSAVDVAGFYQSGGTKRTWSVKGKMRLDGNNMVHIKLEEIAPKRNTDFDKGFGDNGFGNSGFGDNGFGNSDFGKSSFGNTKKASADNAGCSPMSSSSFDDEVKKIKKEFSMMSQEKMAKQLISSNCLSASQIKELIKAIQMSTTQEEIAIAAYSRCSDPDNYQTVIDAITSFISKDRVKEATIGK